MPRAARKLEVVKPPSEKPKNRGGRPITRLTSAIDRDERTLLVALRRKLASKIDEGGCRAEAFGVLIRQLRDVDAQIRGLDARAAQDLDDEDEEDDDGDSAAFDPATC